MKTLVRGPTRTCQPVTNGWLLVELCGIRLHVQKGDQIVISLNAKLACGGEGLPEPHRQRWLRRERWIFGCQIGDHA